MARTKMTAKQYNRVRTWTRFHLPLEQEWPTWPVAHSDVHVGPLADVQGILQVWLGRMVEDPEHAAYIIEWGDPNDLENFKSSPACAEFLRNLPEINHLQVSVESTSSALGSLTIEDAPSPSSPLVLSRFLTLKEITGMGVGEVEGRVTFNAFLVPRKGDWPTMWTWYESLREVLGCFYPRGFEFIADLVQWEQYTTTWFWTLAEDGWVESKFGKLEQAQEDTQCRTVICEFHLWSGEWGPTPEHEEASATDPQARESWNEAVAKVMPPVTAWVQERWDIRRVPRHYPSQKIDSSEDVEQ